MGIVVILVLLLNVALQMIGAGSNWENNHYETHETDTNEGN